MMEEIGMEIPCSGGFWRDLERAATEMKLYARVPMYRKQFERALCRGASSSNADNSDL
jgi:hypothetical protein